MAGGPLDQVSTSEAPCAEHTGRVGVCSGEPVLRALAEFSGAAGPAPAVVAAAAEQLGCDSELCVVSHPAFRKFLGKDPALLRGALQDFKPAGPRDSTALLSNVEIDSVLAQWVRVFPGFCHCPFAMMDFEATGGPFAEADLAALGCSTFACVLNTDVSSGPGKHWVVVFADLRSEPATVEYFNSAGNPPPLAVTRWMERAAARLRAAGREARTVAVTSTVHQRSRTECGLYVVFYVRARLEGVPFGYFFDSVVPDDAMTAFRRHLFRPAA